MIHSTSPDLPAELSGHCDGEPTDYADMGTAFGLDATLAAGAALPGEPASAAACVAPPWEYRLTRRTGL